MGGLFLLAGGLFGCDLGEPEVLGAVATSCAFADYGEPREERLRLEIATFWIGDGESQAYEVLRSSVDPAECTVSTTPRNGRIEQLTSLLDWVAEGSSLPDAFQLNAGSDVLHWVSGGKAERPELCSLSELSARYRWEEKFFSSALEPLRCRGELFGLPVGVHRLNTVLVNPELYASLETLAAEQGESLPALSELDDLEAFIDVLERAQRVAERDGFGRPVVPLALGVDSTWPLTILAFENFLVSFGEDAYETLWYGGLQGASGEREAWLRGVLELLFDRLERTLAFARPEAPLSWQDAVVAVAQGDALFTVMGDWSLAQLNQEQRARVRELRFPGTVGAYVYTPDSFAIPRIVERDGAAPHLWLREIVESREVQLRFAARKNSIPSLRGLASEELPTPELRESYERFAECQDSDSECRLLLAVSGLGPTPSADPCFDRMGPWLARAVDYPLFEPETEERELGVCARGEPASAAEARSLLLELLLDVARSRFAADCR